MCGRSAAVAPGGADSCETPKSSYRPRKSPVSATEFAAPVSISSKVVKSRLVALRKVEQFCCEAQQRAHSASCQMGSSSVKRGNAHTVLRVESSFVYKNLQYTETHWKEIIVFLYNWLKGGTISETSLCLLEVSELLLCPWVLRTSWPAPTCVFCVGNLPSLSQCFSYSVYQR